MKVIGSLILLGLLGWLVPYSCQERHLRQDPARVIQAGPKAYSAFAEAQYHLGRASFHAGDLDAARGRLRAALRQNVVHVDAWLMLAEVELQGGDADSAKKILAMLAELITGVLRWKWPQALLAQDLGMEDAFTESLNALISDGRQVNDCFWLLENHFGAQVAVMIEHIGHENREAYLRWLMRWRRAEGALLVWQALGELRRSEADLRLSFINFLINNNQMEAAQTIWHEDAGGNGGITNPGFEEPPAKMGFDWRFSERPDEWRIEVVPYPVHSGRRALEVRFTGAANSNFHHLYQFVPVTGDTRYHLTYWWKSQRLTTDQGPFLEIYGQDCKGWNRKGPMLSGTEDWNRVVLDFLVPEGCHTAVIRLRRVPSRRFDCKIEGALWLDDFTLQKVGKDE